MRQNDEQNCVRDKVTISCLICACLSQSLEIIYFYSVWRWSVCTRSFARSFAHSKGRYAICLSNHRDSLFVPNITKKHSIPSLQKVERSFYFQVERFFFIFIIHINNNILDLFQLQNSILDSTLCSLVLEV